MTTAPRAHTRARASRVRTLQTVDHLMRRFTGGEKRAPGPPKWYLPVLLKQLFDDQLAFFEQLHADYGDVAFVHLGKLPTYVLYDPELIEQVVMREASKFRKDDIIVELEKVLGRGLLTSEGDFWRRQRKLAAPALKRKQIASYADSMVRHTREWADALHRREVVDIHEDMMAVTLRIVVETLFALDVGGRVEEVGHAMEVVLQHFTDEVHSLWRFVPESIPSPKRARFKVATERLDRVIYELIAERKADATPGDDLLYRLIVAVDDEGTSMTDEQLRNEAMTMFAAGHETTALACTYAFRQLAQRPDLTAALTEEFDRVLGDRDPTLDDVRELTFTEALVKETLRAHPPAWIIGRAALEDTELGPYPVRRRDQVLAPVWVIHHDERFFHDPWAFKPERWLDGSTDDLPRFAYFPFGGGPRVCIGQHFAMMEAILIIATAARRWRFERVDDAPLRYTPAVTMRPTDPVYLRVMNNRHVASASG